MRILLIEDDESMRLGVTDLLRSAGYHVDVEADGPSGLETVLAGAFDLVVLDIMLPGLDGLSLCRDLRSRGCRVPVLMLTARAWVEQRIEGLDAGGDDYLVKPFDSAELLARVRALLRRSAGDPSMPEILALGDARIDFNRETATRSGRDIGLSAREFRILFALASAAGRPVSRDEILDRAWPPGACPTQRTIDNHIVSLRSKLEPDPSAPQFIVTVHRVGYRLENENAENFTTS